MMRKVAVLILCLLLIAPALAVPGNGNGHGKAGNSTPSLQEDDAEDNVTVEPTKAPGKGKPLTVKVSSVPPGQVKKNATLHERLREEINQTADDLENETGALPPEKQKVWKNQNEVRLAVHTFLALGEMDGGIGKNVSAIARTFNNSVQTRLQVEEQIQARPGWLRFLAGGDETAAETLFQSLNQSRDQIREMQRLVENCTCDNETRSLLQDQLRVMEEEQERLLALAGNETADRGVIGWIWK
ncbi:hypothetical protein [uncultured Methanofollis sp.]|uniref:hypothetical protein n=1 Tax=uncultured Methanofollis sp. TaxID=262500 RepID=UPI002623811C|nr:hypothetical protein [uncultured Methanofollis sp.]